MGVGTFKIHRFRRIAFAAVASVDAAPAKLVSRVANAFVSAAAAAKRRILIGLHRFDIF